MSGIFDSLNQDLIGLLAHIPCLIFGVPCNTDLPLDAPVPFLARVCVLVCSRPKVSTALRSVKSPTYDPVWSCRSAPQATENKPTASSKLKSSESVETWPGRDCILSVLARADVVTFLCSFARHSQGRVCTRQPELCSALGTCPGVAAKPSQPRE